MKMYIHYSPFPTLNNCIHKQGKKFFPMNGISILKTIIAICFAAPIVRFLCHQVRAQANEGGKETEAEAVEQPTPE